MSKASTTFESTKDVVRAGGELYHLQQARRTHGDAPVLSHLATDFRSREGLTASDSFIRAGQFLNDIDRTINHGFGFKKMRTTLDADASKISATSSSLPALKPAS